MVVVVVVVIFWWWWCCCGVDGAVLVELGQRWLWRLWSMIPVTMVVVVKALMTPATAVVVVEFVLVDQWQQLESKGVVVLVDTVETGGVGWIRGF